MSSHFFKVEHVINGHHTREYVAATANGDKDIPKLSVNQYIPLDNTNPQPGDVTIIAAHANGFPKELYEPLWDEMYKSTARSGTRIRSIWIADMWNQGKSGILNENILGNDPSWSDHARDLMNLINQKQDSIPHPIIGIGHSMGGAQISLLSIWHPRLLHSLILIDPVIQVQRSGVEPAALSTSRRDVWPSKKMAESKFQRSKFYQAWDHRVLRLWVDYGLRQTPTALYPDESDARDLATLATSKHQELFTYLRPTYRADPSAKFEDRGPPLPADQPNYNFYRPEPAYVFHRLPEIRPSVLYVFGQNSDISQPERRKEKMEATGAGVGGSGGLLAGRVTEIVLDCGHLIPMEKVEECAQASVNFLVKELQRWRREQDEFSQYWSQKTREEQTTIDTRWAQEVRPGRKSAQKSVL